MDHLFDWRIPAQKHVAHCDGQHAHTASRANRERQFPVIDNNYIHAFLLAAAQGRFLHRPGWGARSYVVMSSALTSHVSTDRLSFTLVRVFL